MSVRLDIDIETLVPDFSLSVKQSMDVSGITAIYGPSGAGKTTLLRVIAGFQKPNRGQVIVDGEVWDIPAHKRPVGFVFQDSRLFEHLSVKGNLDYARKRAANNNTKFGMNEIIDAFDLADLLHRAPASLSGGEKKRAALGRTLLSSPKLLLLDEPLAGLDRARKREILPFIESLPKRFNIPCLCVSHDIEEVSRLADDMLVLSGGRVKAYGPAVDVIGQVDLSPLSGEGEPSTLIEAIVRSQDQRLALTFVTLGNAPVTLPLEQRLSVGDRVRLRIRAKDVALSRAKPEGISIRNILECKLEQLTSNEGSAFVDVILDVDGILLRSRITRAAAEDLELRAGLKLYALIKTMSFEGRLI